jgi:hypothetical protein
MSYIGNEPTSVAFLTDTFSGNGSTTAFTLSRAPANTSSIIVAISGVLQDPSTYSVSGTTLTFSPAPPTGSSNISVRFLGIPASGVTTTAYRTVTEFTATSGQTTFSVPSYTAGFIDVYRNGVMLGSADYTATNGTTVVLASGATAGDLVEVISFYVSSVLNAISSTAGSVGTSNIASGVTINFADGSASAPSITNDGDTNTGIFFPAADTIAFAEGGAEVARFDSSGRLGVGTTNPSERLQATSGGASNAFLLANNGLGSSYYGVDGSGTAYCWNAANYPVIFGTNNLERMRIDSSGNVLVGTTGAIQSTRYSFYSASGRIIGIEDASGGNGTQAVRFVSAGNNCGTISTSTTATSYNTSSDYRLKENVAPMTGALAVVGQLKPCTYKWKVNGLNGQGFIAHELAEVVPQAVTGEKDAVDAEGNPQYQGIDTSFLVATLTAAIQEQQAIINDLKTRIEALENT